jgi:hypothetical protein
MYSSYDHFDDSVINVTVYSFNEPLRDWAQTVMEDAGLTWYRATVAWSYYAEDHRAEWRLSLPSRCLLGTAPVNLCSFSVLPLPTHFKYHWTSNIKYNNENANNIWNGHFFIYSLFNDAVSSSNNSDEWYDD